VSTLSTPTKSLIIESDGRLEQLVSKVIQSGCQNVKPQIPAKINDAMRSLADYSKSLIIMKFNILTIIYYRYGCQSAGGSNKIDN